MNVGELKKILEGMDDDVRILIPLDVSSGFTGEFFSPCGEESGEITMGMMPDMSDEEDCFLLVPHGFFQIDDENDNDFIPELN